MRVASGARGLLLALAVAVGPAGTALAQEPDAAPGRDGARALVLREQLAPFAGPARRILGGDWERFRDTLDALAAQEARQRGLAGEVDFSFSADETGDFSGGPGNETLFGLRAGARLGGGGYRSRVRLLGDMRALIHDNVFEQDFSRVRLGYDHRRTDHLGAFAFIERYSDDAMSIASRYEIGGGVSMGVDLWPRRDDEAGARALAHLASAGPGGFRCGVERLRAGFDPGDGAPSAACVPLGAAPAASPVAADGGNQATAGVSTAIGGRGNGAAVGAPAYRPAAGGPRPDPAVFDGLLDVVDPLERGLAARQAMVSLSLGVGVFSEFENALIETRVSRLDSPAGGPADSLRPACRPATCACRAGTATGSCSGRPSRCGRCRRCRSSSYRRSSCPSAPRAASPTACSPTAWTGSRASTGGRAATTPSPAGRSCSSSSTTTRTRGRRWSRRPSSARGRPSSCSSTTEAPPARRRSTASCRWGSRSDLGSPSSLSVERGARSMIDPFRHPKMVKTCRNRRKEDPWPLRDDGS